MSRPIILLFVAAIVVGAMIGLLTAEWGIFHTVVDKYPH